MHDARTLARRPRADLADGAVIHAIGKFRLVFCAIDRRVCRRVYDHIGARFVERGRERLRRCEIGVETMRTIGRTSFARRGDDIGDRLKRTRELETDLTICTENENSHSV
jgi:hypothetical protein